MSVQTNPEVTRQAHDTMMELLSRSATDLEFRRKLLTDPRAAVAEFTGREVPENFNVRFVENTADATFVLPDYVGGEAELAEEELEAVAGGGTPVIASILTIIASIGKIVTD